MIAEFTAYILYFSAYSVIGWAVESAYCSLRAKKLINRGFLAGPICPIYGFGGLIMHLLSGMLAANPLLAFIVSTAVAAILGYCASYGLERFFDLRLWDHSGEPFNFNGRICLRWFLMLGLAGLLVVYLLAPAARWAYSLVPRNYARAGASLAFVFIVVDFLQATTNAMRLRESAYGLQSIVKELRAMEREGILPGDAALSMRHLRALAREDKLGPEGKLLIERYAGIVDKRGQSRRLLMAYPSMRMRALDISLDNLRSVLHDNARKLRERGQEKTARVKTSARNARGRVRAIYGGLLPYKLVWIFFLSSLIGYMLEMVYCVVLNGVVESRQGMLIGPFNQVYGLGAVIMVLVLLPLSRKNDRWLFFGGMILGGAIEFLFSFFQEAIFGSVSWEYSTLPFSIQGRANLFYMFFWGILGLLFMKEVYPRMDGMIGRVPRRQGRAFAVAMAVFLVLDMGLSALAVHRWSERMGGADPSPTNAMEAYLDEYYGDAQMREIYPHMHFDPADKREAAKRIREMSGER